MKKYPYEDAKKTIDLVCQRAEDGEFDTREKFMSFLDDNPYIAAQGYNSFGKIFYWNTASSDVYGYRESEAINQDLIELIIPPEMRPYVHDMLLNARKSGKMPDGSACDLLKYGGDYVTVYSGHLIFSWDNATSPEFYCIDLPMITEDDRVSIG